MKVVHEGGPWTRSRWWSMDWGSVLCIYPTGNASFETKSTHSTDSTGGSMFINHTDVRMTRKKVWGGLNLSESGM